MPDPIPTPLFMTHHPAPGAWAGLTFGVPGMGASIDHEHNEIDVNADLLVAVSRGPGEVRALPFVSGAAALDPETVQREAALGKLDKLPNSPKARWRFLRENEIEREIDPCCDRYGAGDFTFRAISRPPVFPDLEAKGALAKAAAVLNPSILLELEVDNTRSDKPAFAFIGFAIFRERLRTLDLVPEHGLCGIGLAGRWALAALPEKGVVFTVRDGAIARHVERGAAVAEHKGREGGVMRRIEAGKRATLRCAMAFHHEGIVTQGIPSTYAYTRHFKSAEQACRQRLMGHAAFQKESSRFDEDARRQSRDEKRHQVYAQAVRAYGANTQLALQGKKIAYNVSEGCFYWRNTMDLCADHLPFELATSPWLVRNLLDQFLARYVYRDRLKFPGVSGLKPGGLSFTHDMGSYTAYTPKGSGGYEQAGLTGCYSFMTQEELLNGIYLLCGYALASGDARWPKKQAPIFRELLVSLERRDHFDPSSWDGILKGESDRVGETGAEITSYDALDHSLMAARGNTYIAVKTWCAALLLEAALRKLGMAGEARRASAFADRTASTLEKAFDSTLSIFPANLYQAFESRVSAIVEPLAVPLFLGLEKRLRSYGAFVEKLRSHLERCLTVGTCIDAQSGGLRLSSTSTNTWPSKSALVLHVAESFLGFDLEKNHPTLMREYIHWCQISARESTIADQILSDTRAFKMGHYYPRMVTTALWQRPFATGKPARPG
jgi:hypothetical protein